MTVEEFEERYKPIVNPATNNYLFETYGEELETVMQHVDKFGFRHVWTLVDSDGDLYIVPGFRFVNRLNYIITELPVRSESDEEINILY